MRQLETKKQVRGSLAWIGQAISGILLIIVVLLHIYFQHFQAQGLLNADEVASHVSGLLIFTLEILFVIVVSYHALVGLRAIIFDLSLSDAARRKVSLGLTILGLATVIYGLGLAFLIRSQLLNV